MKNIIATRDGIKKYIGLCQEAFLKEYKLDEIDVNILINYTDFILERLDILSEKMKNENK